MWDSVCFAARDPFGDVRVTLKCRLLHILCVCDGKPSQAWEKLKGYELERAYLIRLESGHACHVLSRMAMDVPSDVFMFVHNHKNSYMYQASPTACPVPVGLCFGSGLGEGELVGI